MILIRQKQFAKGVTGQLKKLEAISRGLKNAENDIDIGKWKTKFDAAQRVLISKGKKNLSKEEIKNSRVFKPEQKHVKTVPLKDRTVRLTREERLAKWKPYLQYDIKDSAFDKCNVKPLIEKVNSKRPGTLDKYKNNTQDYISSTADKDKSIAKYKNSIFYQKLREAESSLSPKDKRILRKTIINEAKKNHIKPGNMKSSLAKDKEVRKYQDIIVGDNKVSVKGAYSLAIPNDYSFNRFEFAKVHGTNKTFKKKIQYGDNPKYGFSTLHEIGHLKDLKKGTLGPKSDYLMAKEHFANLSSIKSLKKGDLRETFRNLSKFQEENYNKSINHRKFYNFYKNNRNKLWD